MGGVEDGVLSVADVELEADLFEVNRERKYMGDGEMIEAEGALVIVQN